MSAENRSRREKEEEEKESDRKRERDGRGNKMQTPDSKAGRLTWSNLVVYRNSTAAILV